MDESTKMKPISVQKEVSGALFAWIQDNILPQLAGVEASQITRQPLQIQHSIEDFGLEEFWNIRLAYKPIFRQIIERDEEVQELMRTKMMAIARDLRVEIYNIVEAFNADYKGDADVQFRQYLEKCCNAYFGYSFRNNCPYTTLVQSSGTGKSRLLKQLALKVNTKESTDMKMLYLCARRSLLSTDYPAPTRLLNEFFLEVSKGELIARLIATFEYAITNWDTVGDDWIGLFENEDVDRQTCATLKAFAEEKLTPSEVPKEHLDTRVLVLAIDEAKSLIGPRSDRLLQLRNALAEAT